MSYRAAMLLSFAWLAIGCGDDKAAAPADVVPFSNDPLSVHQGYLPILGVPQAWEHGRGDVVVAVLDNGVELQHPDLQAQLWTNPLEEPNGIDDDGNGLVDDIHGWNFLAQNGDVSLRPAPEYDLWLSHATAVAGIIAAQTDNGIGVAGCCPGCRIMVLKARDFSQYHSVLPRLGAAVDYAIAHGARIINISDGSLEASLSPELRLELEQAAARAENAGVLLVASAGNDGKDGVRWPAHIPSVLAVSAVDWDRVPTSWTTFGEQVDVAAPGTFVYTTLAGRTYGYFSGTSASAPIATALAALLASSHPDWAPAEIAARIKIAASPANLGSRPELKGRFGVGVVSFSAVP